MTGMSFRSQKRQIVSIWLPYLAIDRWQLHVDADVAALPTVLTNDSAHGPRITAINAAARAVGAQVGQRLVDARALHPELKTFEADTDGDKKTLQRLTLWVQRWGPWSMVDGSDAILLDVTGAVHLCNGAKALLTDIAHACEKRGYRSRPALAATAGAAWALSHFGAQYVVADNDNPMLTLADLPIAALRLEQSVAVLLKRLGLKTIGDLHRVPRDDLARRFRDHRNPQANPLIRMDQLLGLVPEPIIPVHREVPPKVSRRLMEPIRHRSLLDQIVSDLADDMVRELESGRLGTRRLELRAYKIDGDVLIRHLEMVEPTRDAKHICRLFSAKLDDIDAGFGIDQVDLVSTWSLPTTLAQTDLTDGPALEGTTLPQMLDRISARLGAGAVQHLVPLNSHIPERAFDLSVESVPADPAQGELQFHLRPLKLLEQAERISVVYETPDGVPRKFRWRGVVHDITRSEGPERVAPEWWKERGRVRLRDYYRIESAIGARYWIYRNGITGDGRGDAPDWYLHGMFA